MSEPCAALDAYLDDSLEAAERERFEAHLLDCARCQAQLEEAMQLLAAGAELARSPERPRAAAAAATADRDRGVIAMHERRRVRPRARWAGAALVAVAAAAGLAIWLGRRPGPGADLEERVVASLATRRSLEVRLPYAPLDRHRSYDVVRGASSPELISAELIAEVERSRSTAEVVAVLIANRSFDQAAAILDRAGREDDLEIARAALAITRHQPGAAQDALERLEGVLARSPANAVARWNHALVLRDLQLPLAAAEAFDAVAKLGEPGWSAEAAALSKQLRDRVKPDAERWTAARQACVLMPEGKPVDLAMVRAYPATCRPSFYAAVRAAPSRDAVLALAPVAEVLDADAHNAAASELVRRVAGVDPAKRQRAVAAYRPFTVKPLPPVDEQRRLIDQLRASDQGDLVLGAISRSDLFAELRDEYIQRARASGDPYYAEYAEELWADSLQARGDILGAEVVLRRAVTACAAREFQLRCDYLQFALVNLYNLMHRPQEAREAAEAGIARSRRLGLYWDERLFLDFIAQAVRLGRAHALMRAYVRETMLRISECTQEQYAQELLAMASIDDLRFAQARQDIAAAPTCDRPPTPERARVLAELARFDGTPDEAAALRAGLAQVREKSKSTLTAGQLANLGAIEGRLVAARDPQAARPLLRGAIDVATQSGRGDSDAAIARRDAYGALLVLGAGAGDGAASLALLAEATGAAPRDGACVVGVAVDAERLLVVVRDARGALSQHFDPRGRTGPTLEARTLIPPRLLAGLAGCPRVDVLALTPVFGLPELLPPELPWSYRGRPGAAPAGPPGAPSVVTVADATPPQELGLAPLGARSLAPIPGATHVELRGAEATPARVISSLAQADAIEIHAHGFVDQGISDAAVIALSPQADGQFALRARDIVDLKLARSPLVLLAACHAAYTAPYRHEPWGLPRAFLLAGARAVLASPNTVPDAEVGEVFRAIEARILAGADPAVALRDERVRRLAADPKSWIRAVLLFD